MLEENDQRRVPAFQALALEKRINTGTAVFEDLPQAVMSIIIAIYLEDITPDMIANSAGAILMALRLLWLAYRTFLLSDRERPLIELFNATSGPSWHVREGWGTARVDLSKWHGVTLDQSGPRGRIKALSLPCNNLKVSTNPCSDTP